MVVKYRPSYLSLLPNFLLVRKRNLCNYVTSNNARKMPLFEFFKQFEQLLYIFVNYLNPFSIHFHNSGLLYWNDYNFKTMWTWGLILNLLIYKSVIINESVQIWKLYRELVYRKRLISYLFVSFLSLLECEMLPFLVILVMILWNYSINDFLF